MKSAELPSKKSMWSMASFLYSVFALGWIYTQGEAEVRTWFFSSAFPYLALPNVTIYTRSIYTQPLFYEKTPSKNPV